MRWARFWAAGLRYEVEGHSGFIASLLADGLLTGADVIELDGRTTFRDVADDRDPGGGGPRLSSSACRSRRPRRT